MIRNVYRLRTVLCVLQVKLKSRDENFEFYLSYKSQVFGGCISFKFQRRWLQFKLKLFMGILQIFNSPESNSGNQFYYQRPNAEIASNRP